MHTRSGRLSLVLWIRPTQVGEAALIWCRAGICFEDLEAHTGEHAAACYAREARVDGMPRRLAATRLAASCTWRWQRCGLLFGSGKRLGSRAAQAG